MNLQYIADNKGKTTGVYIPINDWKYLKNKYKEIEQEERDTFVVSEEQKQLINQRLKCYQENPDKVEDWDNVQKDIEGKYGF